jgi:hypothetical protein
MMRIKDMTMPGVYRKVPSSMCRTSIEDIQVSNAFAKLDTIMHSPCEMTIKEGRQVAPRLRRREPLGLAYLQRPPGRFHQRHLGDDVPDARSDAAYQ